MRLTRFSLLLSSCLTVVVMAGVARARDEKPAAEPLDRKTLEGLIYVNLMEVANHGAGLYNSGDWNGCWRLYEGALMTVRPLLSHRAKLQEAIDSGIADARKNPMLLRRAFVLRAVIDQVRAEVKSGAPSKPKDDGELPAVKKTLWDRLGGEEGVKKVVDDLVDAVGDDPKVDFSRGGKYKLTAEKIDKMKRELVQQVSEATGGPLKYEGPSMKTVHKGMGITDQQYNALVSHLQKVLEKNKVAPEDGAKVVAAVNSYRKDIVEPKKKDEETKDDKTRGNKTKGDK